MFTFTKENLTSYTNYINGLSARPGCRDTAHSLILKAVQAMEIANRKAEIAGYDLVTGICNGYYTRCNPETRMILHEEIFGTRTIRDLSGRSRLVAGWRETAFRAVRTALTVINAAVGQRYGEYFFRKEDLPEVSAESLTIAYANYLLDCYEVLVAVWGADDMTACGATPLTAIA